MSKKMPALVLLTAMAMTTGFVEVSLIPSAPWLRYDPSSAVSALVSLLFGPWAGVGVAVCSWIPHLVADPLGAFMNIMSASSLAFTVAAVRGASEAPGRLVAACVAAVAVSSALSICLNFVVTPVYLGVSYEQVAASVVPELLPFNVMKSSVNVALAMLFARKAARLIDEEGNPAPQRSGS